MEYNFREIEKKWQQWWQDNEVYKVSNNSDKPKYYVLDMFPYPSGAGLHVGHPLGYIASDIYARYKRLKGFNVLHPMGYDAFGLPAEQYAIEHGIHPATSTKQNIENFRKQLDKIGFCFDWSRQVNTSEPSYYKWTQWIFLQLFKSFYNRSTKKAESIETLVDVFESEGNIHHPIPNSQFQIQSTVNSQQSTDNTFTATQWNNFNEATQQAILMEYRLAYCGYGEVNWCEALGTVLANDEVINGVSERGGYPVIKKKLRQWYLRITEYADRLLEGLQTVNFSEAMKEMQTNWIGKSYGAEIDFRLIPNPSPHGEGSKKSGHYFKTANSYYWNVLKEYGRTNRKNKMEAEDILWQRLRNNQLGTKVRRQHAIQGFIVDFAFLNANLIIEIDGEYHDEEEQKKYDEARTEFLKEHGFFILRFSNEEVLNNTEQVINKIKDTLASAKQASLLREENGLRDEAVLKVFTTRPDTIFGVDFMVIAPEHELVSTITTEQQKQQVEDYLSWVKSRSDRERQAEKTISGVMTGAYAINPFNQKEIPIYISEYVLAGYGTGAIMGVPCGDERDFKFAKHFNIHITNIIGDKFNGEEANPTKDAVLENSDFLNGMLMRDAINMVSDKVEALGIGKKKVNYKMRDAAFSRQRYWGEPFPIVWIDGIAYPLNESELPLKLPNMEDIKPGKDGEGPLSNNKEWALIPIPSPLMEKGASVQVVLQTDATGEQNSLALNQSLEKEVASSKTPLSTGGEGLGVRESSTMPGYAGSSWYFLRYMDPHNDETFCNKKASDYWNQVDVYVGGTEHAVGHLLYSRMWTKFLFDLGLISFDEPYKRLLNQGMIQGVSAFAHYIGVNLTQIPRDIADKEEKLSQEEKEKFNQLKEKYYAISNKLISVELKELFNKSNIVFDGYKVVPNQVQKSVIEQVYNDIEEFGLKDKIIINYNIPFNFFRVHVPIEYVNYNNELNWKSLEINVPRFTNVDFIVSENKFICSREVEKMSKSKLNVENPDDVINKYGADTFRMYEMFLGPVEQSKPWDTKGIEGVHRFLKKLWRLFYNDSASLSVRRGIEGEAPTEAELKILHKAIKKIEEDTERFSYNTAISAFMVCVNELSDLKCNKKEILEPLVIMLSSYAPHIAEELYHALKQISPEGGDLEEAASVLDATYPSFDPKYLVESTKEYPISINGKLRTTLNMPLNVDQKEVEETVLQNDVVQKWLEGKSPKKIIFVKGKMINVVI